MDQDSLISAELKELVQTISVYSDKQMFQAALSRAQQELQIQPESKPNGDIQDTLSDIKAKVFKRAGIKGSSRISDLYLNLMTLARIKNKKELLEFLNTLSDSKPESSDSGDASSILSKFSRNTDLLTLPTLSDSVRSVSIVSESKPGIRLDFSEEQELISDLPFLLLGATCKTVTFDGLEAKVDASVSFCLVQDLRNCIEAGLLYQQISKRLEQSNSKKGLLFQSFKYCVKQEIQDYMKVVAAIDKEIRLSKKTPRTEADLPTVKKCNYWIHESLLALRILWDLFASLENKHGGELLQAVYLSSFHGDPFVEGLMRRLLSAVSEPFFEILSGWIYTGELKDPYDEFFVRSKKDLKGRSSWNDRYEMIKAHIPSFLPTELAQKIFLIGKNLNFIKHACKEEDWVVQYSTKSERTELLWKNSPQMLENIEKSYGITVEKVRRLILEKFHLMDHLYALKKYLLLEQGDFVAILLESIGSILNQPANKLYRHTLTSSLDISVRSSNAQYEPEYVLKRLDARLLELSHGEVGWDVFTLEYKLESPLDVIVDTTGNRQYLKVFNFLWRLKRVESTINLVWTKVVMSNRSPILRKRNLSTSKSYNMSQCWRVARKALQEMSHFIAQLQYYILFEVIENSWDQFIRAFNQENCTLDTMIEAHRMFVQDITHKGLLGSTFEQTSMLSLLHEIVKEVLSFTTIADILYRQTVSAQAEPHSLNQSEDFTKLLGRLKLSDSRYKEQMTELLYELAFQPDLAMRFLGVRLNMNGYYQFLKERPGTPTDSKLKEKATSKT